LEGLYHAVKSRQFCDIKSECSDEGKERKKVGAKKLQNRQRATRQQ
jgi:hypothetical protein